MNDERPALRCSAPPPARTADDVPTQGEEWRPNDRRKNSQEETSQLDLRLQRQALDRGIEPEPLHARRPDGGNGPLTLYPPSAQRLMPKVAERRGRGAAGPCSGRPACRGHTAGMTSSVKIAVSLPARVAERARNAVRKGHAPSVSAYVASALEEKAKLDQLATLLAEMLMESGGPLSAAERRAADRALGIAGKPARRSKNRR